KHSVASAETKRALVIYSCCPRGIRAFLLCWLKRRTRISSAPSASASCRGSGTVNVDGFVAANGPEVQEQHQINHRHRRWYERISYQRSPVAANVGLMHR